MTRRYDLVTVTGLLTRYGPLLEWLEENGTYGDFMLIMHGRVPRKIGRVGKLEHLRELDDDFVLDITGKA